VKRGRRSEAIKVKNRRNYVFVLNDFKSNKSVLKYREEI
jgi:hypothetical protein